MNTNTSETLAIEAAQAVADIEKGGIFSLEETKHTQLPKKFIFGRDLYLQLPHITENLYDVLKDKKEFVEGIEAEVYRKGGRGKFELVKSKYPIDLDLFPSFVLAVSKNLYNQSFVYGNLKDERGNIILRGAENATSETSGMPISKITIPLRSFIQDVHGTKRPNDLQEKKVIGLLRALQDSYISITYKDGGQMTSSLCYFQFSKENEKAPQMLHLILPKIWSETLKGFGNAPQNLAYKLTDSLGVRKTPAHIKLTNLLLTQDTRKPFKRNIETLISELNFSRAYAKNKLRVENKILTLCQDLVEANLLIERFIPKVTTTKGRESLTGIEIYLKKEEKEEKEEK